MTYQMPQHAASNSRNPSDLYLIPDHYDFLGEVGSEIKLMKDMYEYVEVSQDRITQLRQESNNSLNYGDAIEKILKKELNNKSYSGMIDGHKVLEGFFEELVESLEETIEIKEGTMKHKKIFTSLFDSTNKITYYFLRQLLGDPNED